MRIAFNPSTVAALTSPPNNKDITFDLRGQNIFARGVKFYGTDTNTWRDIKINNVSIGSHTLDLRNGSNTTLTNTNGIVTINSTWRPVVDNLTSNSATSSLSANQGRVLAGLINGKSDSDHNHDGRYIRKSGDTMLGALNFANGTWNLVGDDSYMGDCNISGHFGIKAANTTYPGIAFFNKTGNHLGNLTAYSGNIKYGAYSLQFLDNGNTSVSASTWTNPFSAYNSNAVADGQAICVWGQASQLSNLSTDTGDMSLWLKRVNAHAATLNMVLDGEYYANGNQRLAHISEIPTSLKNPHSLILKANGTTLAIYDGSSAKEANFTYANVGAASASHTHSYYAVNENYGGFKKAERLPTSGFYQSNESESGGNAPWKSWMHLINCQHSNTNNNHALQIAASFYDNNTFKIRVTSNSVNNAWRDIIHSGNISSQSVASASKLQTARNIWGQSFDGTADVSGSLSGVANIQFSANNAYDIGSNSAASRYIYTHWLGARTGQKLELGANNSNFGQGLCLDTNLNVGIGTNSPTQKLDVRGNIVATGNLYISHATNNNMNHDTSNPRIVFSESGSQAVGLVYTDYDSYRPSKGLKVMDTDNVGTSNVWFEVQGYNYSSGYVKNGSNDNYVLLGGGGHKAESSLRVAYASNADMVDGYHASGLWRSDGGTWNPNANISLTASGNNQEWSFNIYRNGHTGCYWHVWDNALGTLLKVNADNGKVYAPYNFVGNLEGNANTANSATNADMVDGWHKDEINRTLYITSGISGLSSYWAKLWEINLNNQYNDVTITFLAAASYYPSYFSIFSVYLRQNGSGTSKGINARLVELIGNIAVGDTELRLYVNNTTGNCQLWGNVKNQYGTMNLSVLKKAWRTDTDSSNIGTFFSTSFSSVQSLPGDGWYKVGVIQQGVVGAFNPSSHTHTWTSITDKIVAGNEFNIVNAGFKEDLWFNYLPINDRSKSATISAYCFGNGNKGYTAVRALGFIKNGGNEDQLLRADGGVAAFNWSGQSGQPAWLWGGNDFNSYYVYNPSNFRVAYAASAGNAGTLGGFPKNYGQAPFGTIPCIGNDGVMEVGKYIDFHNDNSGKYDFSTRLQTTGNYGNEVNLPSASGTLALISQVLTWKSQIIDMRSYSESYWHPVTVPLPYTGYNKIKVSVQLNSGDKPSWATHRGGITCNMEIWATASGWGTTDSDTICLNYTYKFCSQNPCGWMQLGNPSLGVVFLRGGSRYTVYTDFDATFTPHNQKYTWSSGGSSQDTGGPYTSCPGLNFNMGTIRADLIATMVQARRVCAGHDPGIDNSISCSNWFRSSGNTGWYNTTYKGGWYMSDTSWIRAHNDVGIYTGGQICSGSSIRMGNILLEHTDEINNITNDGGLKLNYRSPGNVSLCVGGGKVGIGTMSPVQKLDVNGQVIASGFHHSSVNSDNYMLLAGGGYKSFGGDDSNPIFLGYLNLDHGNDGTISSSFSCLGYSVPFTYTRGGNYCRIYIPDTTLQVFYIKAATASVNYSGGGMDTWTGGHRGSGAWWLHCYAYGANEIRVKGFCQNNNHNDSWWGGNPLWSGNDGANKITVCIFGYVKFR